jgi:hypothetical protein
MKATTPGLINSARTAPATTLLWYVIGAFESRLRLPD